MGLVSDVGRELGTNREACACLIGRQTARDEAEAKAGLKGSEFMLIEMGSRMEAMNGSGCASRWQTDPLLSFPPPL